MLAIAEENDALIACIYGEIDHHSARDIREELDGRISRFMPKSLVLDFGHVSFMDSSGIGLIMGRYKLMGSLGGTITIRGASETIRRVMVISGIPRLAEISE